MGVIAFADVGKLALVTLAVAGTASVPGPSHASTPITMLPNQLCGRSVPGEINVCGSRLKRADVIRLHDLATCLASQHEKSSREALSAYIQSADLSRFQSIFASDNSCKSGGGLHVSPILLSGAFAEALLVAGSPRASSHGTPLTPAPLLPQDGMMSCFMASGSAEAMTLVKTPLYSRREQAAVANVTARLRTCLPAGAQVRTNLAAFRAVIAIRLFALSSHMETDFAPISIGPAEQPPRILRDQSAVMQTNPLALPALTIRFHQKSDKTGDSTKKITHVDPNMPDEAWIDKRMAQDPMTQTGPETGESTAIMPDSPPQ
ncbi:hypothetical protein [Sphingomonas abietis]|uniref:DUF1311 domain-containing protein n=1 Tax=Sphingomonas abietis TaxID=3012344 RepID=A0ABY7NL81_9SPHN|nr:hypothetical protein [Sphingomonas abietis]WBO22268.1 hypothetical protein PBT88_19315 [Sphingomonas abietis]